MNILILGQTGFIGSSLLKKIKETDNNVIAPLRHSVDNLDLRNYENLEKYIKDNDPQVIFNLASHGGSVHYYKANGASVFNDNVQMSLNLYRAISHVNKDIKIIQPFSNCSYPGSVSVQSEEDWLSGEVHDSVSSFGNSKRVLYYISKYYKDQFGINSVNLLFPNAYGPGDTDDLNKTHALNGMVIRMIKAKRAGAKTFTVWGTGRPVREWIYVEDFVKALILGQELNDIIYPINVGKESGCSILESANHIKRHIGFEGEIILDTSYQDGDPIKILKGEKFKSLFPEFSWYDHQEGIQKTAEYYQEIL